MTQNMNEILSFVSSATGESTGLGERAGAFDLRHCGVQKQHHDAD